MKNKIIFTKDGEVKAVRESSLGQILILKSAGWVEKEKPNKKDKEDGKKQS